MSMRKVILFMVISLDGFIAGENGELDFENQDQEIGGYLIPELLKTVDTMVIGRVLYEGFEQFWPAAAKDPSMPKEIVEFAQWVDDAPKIVFSKTLKKVGWKNSSLESVKTDEDIVKAVKKLKQQPGGDMVLFGGVRLAQTFVRLGLVDEYRFKLQPIILGQGKPLFKNIKDRLNLKLLKSKSFESGVVGLYYVPVGKEKKK